MDIERRISASGLEVRRTKEGPRLAGYACRWNVLSEDLGGFRERIAPKAFGRSLDAGVDVRALINHDTAKVIGRRSAGTLELAEDDKGLHVTIDPPDTQVGKDIVASIERGDTREMSFGFRATKDSWRTNHRGPKGEAVRTVHEADLYEISTATFPAYPQTEIAVRSLAVWKKGEDAMPETEVVDTDSTSTEAQPSPEAPENNNPQPERRSRPSPPATPADTATRDPSEWRDMKNGREVRVLRPEQKLASPTQETLSLGRAVRALMIGSWEGAEAEQRAMSTVANPTAGILVPDALSSRVIDLARARSVLIAAGAKTVDMESGTQTIARVSADPTMETKAENAAFTGYDVTFDAVELVAYTIGTVVKMSRELAQDAPNAVAIIEDVLSRALAAKIDYYGLQGTGSAQPLGLINFGSTNTVTVGGSVDYADILNGIKENESDNHVSNALVISPTNINVLRLLLVNSEANHYAPPPPAVAALQTFVTTGIPDTDAVVGDFSQFLIGLRQGALIEMDTSGTAFAQHQVWVKVTWRGCFNTEHRDAFCLLQSIS